MAQLPEKKPPLRTIRVPEGLPSPKKSTKVSSTRESRVRPVKTVQGEVVKDSLPSSQKALSESSTQKRLSAPKALPKGEAVKSIAKTVGKTLLKRAGIAGAVISGAMALHDLATSNKSTEEKKTPNVDSTGKSTKITMEKKPTRPTKKPTAPSPKKSTKKSATRIAFEKEFRKQRNAGAKEFTFRGKKFNTKLAKG